MASRELPGSEKGVCEVRVLRPAGAEDDAPPDLLIEIPHGATRGAEFRSLRRRLSGTYPDDLEAFFFVNTDVGAPECALTLARLLARTGPAGPAGTEPAAGFAVAILRSRIPRTFADCNRVVEAPGDSVRAADLTPALPPYVRDPADVAALGRLHAAYQRAARAAYETVCGNGGLALMLHTYAPRAVRVERIDDGIVAALRRAYEPGRYERWEPRPDVDLITEATDGTRLAPRAWSDRVRKAYARTGVAVTENATYRLDPATTGHAHATAWPDRTLCIEISRARLAVPFTPFSEMTIGREEAERMAAPLASACLGQLAAR